MDITPILPVTGSNAKFTYNSQTFNSFDAAIKYAQNLNSGSSSGTSSTSNTAAPQPTQSVSITETTSDGATYQISVPA